MSDPYAVPDWQRWQVTVTEPLAVPPRTARWAWWLAEPLVAAIVVAYSVVLGGAVGLVWPKVSPHIRLVDAINGSEAATKSLLGDDLWLALLGIVAGVVSVGLLFLAARGEGSGTGGVIGLAVGGLLGSLVAARVGHLVQQPHITTDLRSSFPGITPHSVHTILGYFTFKVRARAVLVAWPITAIVVHSLTGAVRQVRLTTPR